MKRMAARELVGGVERFPVEAGVAGLSEEWAARALEALRVAVVSRNRAGWCWGAWRGCWCMARAPLSAAGIVSVNASGGGAAQAATAEWSGAAEIYSRRAGLRGTSGR
jgi:hypothetical protein